MTPAAFDDLEGKHVVVVGGSSGMGLAVGKAAATAGARVTLVARNRERLQAAAAQVPRSQIRVCDLRESATISAAFADDERVDHLVITAGTYNVVPISASEPHEWRGVLEERLIGPLHIIKLLAPRLTTSIVLFSGTVSTRPFPGITVAAAAVAGVESMARALSLELSPLRVNTVVAGLVDTPMVDKSLAEKKAEVFETTAQRLPAKRVGQPQDAAHAALFLMANPYVTGASITLDGGGVLV